MNIRRAVALVFALTLAAPAAAFAQAPAPAAAPKAGVAGERNDFANPKFAALIDSGLKHFYAREFKPAQNDFERALGIIGDNTFAISFLNASAANQPGAIDTLVNVEEDAATGTPKNYINHVRLGFSYMFQSISGRDRTADARDELNAAANLRPSEPAAHVGLGILRYNERSANRAKAEMLLALKASPNDVLAREYLGELYQTDLQDPARGLTYVIDVPNLVPGYADIQFHIGSILYDLKQYGAALEYLQRGVALDSGHVSAAGQFGYTLMARVYIDTHHLAQAREALNDALAADVDTILANTLLEKIKNGDYDEGKTPAKP